MKLKAACFPGKDQIAAFCDTKLEASNFLANRPKHVSRKIMSEKRSLARKRRKSLFSET